MRLTWSVCFSATVLLFGVAVAFTGANSSTSGGSATQDAPLQIGQQSVELRAGFVGNGIVRFQVLPLDADGNVAETSDEPHLVPQSWIGEPLRVRVVSDEAATQTTESGHRLAVDASGAEQIRVQLSSPENGPSTFANIDRQTGRVTFPIDGPIFGLGEGDQPHDRRGSVNTMAVGGWNDPEFPLNDWGEHLGIPWIVSPNGWGAYFHGLDGTFDLTGEEGVFAPRQQRGRGGRRGRGNRGQAAPGQGEQATPFAPLDAFLVVADQPAGLMKAWAEITGYPSLPPMWSLGYIQSHRVLDSDAQVMEIARTFRERELPCDMLIYLGTGFAPVGWNTDHGEFVFNEIPFPRPEEQLQQLHDMNFRVALHVTPRGSNPPRRLTGNVGDVEIDGELPDGEYDPNIAAHYWTRHAGIMRRGVDAWWPDEGEGASAASRLARIKMYWDGPQLLQPDQRPFALHRTGAVGMQRYGGWLWSGDIKSNWDVLRRQVPLGLNVSVGCTPYWGTDTGGFYQDQNRELDGELYARWFQYSAFCPLFRSHGRDWRYRHIPWGFSDIEGQQRNPRIEEICRTYLDLRYQLMPYTYSLVYDGHETGMPIMRPMWLHHPTDEQAVALGDQYLWGESLLVAPVVERGATRRGVYLPTGLWYDYWTGEALEGGREISREVDLATLPLYVKAGAIIPHGPKENFTGERPNNPLTIRVYPGADGAFSMIEDDGLTFSSAPMRVNFTWNDDAKTFAIALAPGSALREPLPRSIGIELIGTDQSQQVEFSGESVNVQF